MHTYKIQYKTLVNGVWEITYHNSIIVNQNTEAMNVYSESIIYSEDLAKVFYDKDEAIKISNLFSSAYHTPKVLTLIEDSNEHYY